MDAVVICAAEFAITLFAVTGRRIRTMPTRKAQAVAGVSASTETDIMTVYPSIAATSLGRLLGVLYEAIPVKICGIKVSHILFCLPTAPLAVLTYFVTKAVGKSYVLTNRSVKVYRMTLGARGNLVDEVALTDIGEVILHQQGGQEFYRASDIVIVDQSGNAVLELPGVTRAEIFRGTILKSTTACVQTESALATIAAR